MFATQSQFAAVGRGKKREMVDNYKNIIPSVILEIINTGGGGTGWDSVKGLQTWRRRGLFCRVAQLPTAVLRGGENGRWFGSYACSLRITDRGGNARNFYNASTNTLFELEWYKTV